MRRQEESPSNLTEVNLAPLSVPAELRRGASDEGNLSPVSFASSMSDWGEEDTRFMDQLTSGGRGRGKGRGGRGGMALPKLPMRRQPSSPIETVVVELQNPLQSGVSQAQEETPAVGAILSELTGASF